MRCLILSHSHHDDNRMCAQTPAILVEGTRFEVLDLRFLVVSGSFIAPYLNPALPPSFLLVV